MTWVLRPPISMMLVCCLLLARILSVYWSAFSFSNIRNDLFGKELHAATSLFMRKRANLATRQYIPGAELLLKLCELLSHSGRAAHNGEHSILDLLPGIDVSKELVLVFQNRYRRLD